MRERAVLIGAELTWLRRVPSGTEVQLRVPVRAPDEPMGQVSGPEPT